MIGSIANGRTKIENILLSDDTICTIDSFRKMGISIEVDELKKEVIITGNGLKGLNPPADKLYCGNSGTTMRLISGILIGQDFQTEIVGDESLSNRPMARIIKPLRAMGGNIKGHNDKFPPLTIYPCKSLKGIEYNMPVASAQVKSSILLASLYSEGTTTIIENRISRDHTERMLDYYGAHINYSHEKTVIMNNQELTGQNIFVPGDISSAAFLIVGASIIKDSYLTIKDVGINPTRAGIIKVLKSMGANISINNIRELNKEPLGDISVKYSPLKGIELDENIIGTLIDEIPIIAVAAAFAEGKTIIRNAEELKHKETDRIKAIATELKKMDADISELEDGLIINGKPKLKPATLNSYNDHRIAMALSIAALNTNGVSIIINPACINISYPNFYKDLGQLTDNLFDFN